MSKTVSILFFVILTLSAIAQPKGAFDRKKEITYDGKRYKVFNNYLTIGAGTEYNSYLQNTQFNLGGDFNYHIRAVYFQSGFFLAGNHFGNWNHAQFHTAIGKRFEMTKVNLAGYLGGSISSINRPIYDSVIGDYRSNTLHPLGLHATAQFTFKIKYDVGIGLALFSDINKTQSVYGIRAELYFSSAFLGYRKHQNDESILYQD